MRLDGQAVRDAVRKVRLLLQEKSARAAERVRRRVAAVVQGADEPPTALNGKLLNAREWYEEFTGIDEVRAAQHRVVSSEAKFISAQEARRQASKKLTDLQTKLRDVYGELEKTRRGEDRYIFLVTQEHALMKEEEVLTSDFQRVEQEERENFSILSSAVKESHEKERLQAERTKYWSIIGSVLGTVLGVAGSTINNRYKMNEFRSILGEAVTTEERLELLITDKIADRLQSAIASNNNINNDSNNKNNVPARRNSQKEGGQLSKKELDEFYEGIVLALESQDRFRKTREDFFIITTLSAGAAFLIYKLCF